MSEAAVSGNVDVRLAQLLESNDLKSARNFIDSLELSFIDNVKTLLLCARVCRMLNDFDLAKLFSLKAKNIEPDNYFPIVGHSTDLLKLGKLREAEAVLKEIPANLRNEPIVLLHQSKLLYQKKDFESAVRLLVNLVQQKPDLAPAHMELAHSLLMHGKWRAGWIEYEWRYQLPKTQHLIPKLPMPHWDGQAQLPHILLIADQGYGDCFQLFRYLPLVQERCQKISLIRSKPLSRLLDAHPAISFSSANWEEIPRASAYCTLSGLPRLFSTRPHTIPECGNALKADEQDVARWRQRIQAASRKAKLRVGIAWSGRPEFGNNIFRAVPVEKLKKLLDIEEVQFFSLQVGTFANEIKHKNLVNLSLELTDFAETAAAMQSLDLIISADTSVLNLAGALERPTWAMLSYAPDWRWGSVGSFCPWYPSMLLFRQEEHSQWDSVIAACAKQLQNLLQKSSPVSALSSLIKKNAKNATDPYV